MSQGVHAAAEPASALYVPLGQKEHGPPTGPKKPAAQVQFARDELPAGASKLRGQEMQVPEKTVDSPVVVE